MSYWLQLIGMCTAIFIVYCLLDNAYRRRRR